MTSHPRYLTASEAAPILRMGVAAVVLKCRSGEIPAYKPGRAWLIREDDLVAHIASTSNQRKPEAS